MERTVFNQAINSDHPGFPNDLPPNLTVLVTAGEHKGKPQLQARHAGYKLVIEPTRVHYPKAGETWKVNPMRLMPASRVVFCEAWELVLSAKGEHRLVTMVKPYIDQEGRAWLTLHGSKVGWTRNGTLVKAIVEGGQFIIKMTGGHQETPGELDFRPSDLEVRFPVEHVFPEHRPGRRLVFVISTGGRRYRLVL